MRLIHYLDKHWEAPFTGVCRFSRDFSKAFPETINAKSGQSFEWRRGDVAVTDNHLSLRIPAWVQTVVVAHGCAPYHFEVDTAWRSPGTEQIATAQRLMFHVPNRIFVAPSRWVADTFKRYAPPTYDPLVLPHHAEIISGDRARSSKPVVIGDFRTANKGSGVIDRIRAELSEYEFRNLNFDANDDAARHRTYSSASVYLCLSLSEGAPYSVADAEAASLPIATTVTGNVHEFENVWQIEDRNDVDCVRDALTGALAGRGSLAPNFFVKHTFEAWQAAWQVVVAEASKRSAS